MIIPLNENIALRNKKNKYGKIPSFPTLRGRLKIPVPIALANNAKIAPLKEPSCIGPNHLAIIPFLIYICC